MLRLLADENLPRLATEALRADGHDVLEVRAVRRGMSDHDVTRLAESEQRILVTSDKGFGRIFVQDQVGLPTGIILTRLDALRPEAMARLLVQALAVEREWEGHLAVIEVDRVRFSPLTPSR